MSRVFCVVEAFCVVGAARPAYPIRNSSPECCLIRRLFLHLGVGIFPGDAHGRLALRSLSLSLRSLERGLRGRDLLDRDTLQRRHSSLKLSG